MIIVCHLSDSVDGAGATYSVMELVDFKNSLAMKNFTLSDRLQEAQYNSEEGFRRFRWFLVQMAYD